MYAFNWISYLFNNTNEHRGENVLFWLGQPFRTIMLKKELFWSLRVMEVYAQGTTVNMLIDINRNIWCHSHSIVHPRFTTWSRLDIEKLMQTLQLLKMKQMPARMNCLWIIIRRKYCSGSLTTLSKWTVLGKFFWIRKAHGEAGSGDTSS